MKKLIVMSLLALAGTLAVPSLVHAQLLPQYQTSELDGIVAVVQDEVILRSELDQAVTTVKQQFADDPSRLPPEATLRSQVLDRLVLQKLQVQKANDMGIRTNQDEVNAAINGIARDNGLSSSQMQRELAQRGISVADFQQQISEQIVVQKLRQQVLQQQVQVTDAEIDNLLQSPTFDAGEVHLAHITIAIPQGASAADIASAGQQADEVEQALNGGLDFTAAAIRYSQAPDALEGGDLGWVNLGQLPPQFVEVLGKLSPGQFTPPLRDAGGFHIIKLIAQRTEPEVIVTEYHARHISVNIDTLTTDDAAEAKIRRLRQEVEQGKATFIDVAKADSDDDTTANVGGDMGWFPANGWGEAVGERITALQDGEISQPFKASGAWHIIERLGERQQDRTADARRDKARQTIENRKSEDVYNNFLRQLRGDAYVDIRLGDTGADEPKAS